MAQHCVCRSGFNTGEVVASESSARQALVTGDAVNVAARLEQAATPGQVLIADATLRLVRDAVVAEAVVPLELKGKSEPVTAHRLLAVHAGAAGVAPAPGSPARRPRAPAGATPPGVRGRRRRSRLPPVHDPRSPGRREVPARPGGARVARRAGDHRPRAVPLLRRRDHVLAVGRDRARRRRDRSQGDVASSIVPLLPDDPSASEVATRVAQLVGGQTGLALPAEEVGWAVRRFLEGLSRTRPLVVVLDDLQWAEPSLLDLVDQVTDWSRDAPILVICMARPDLLDTRSDWGGGKLHATTVALEPLSAQEAERLVDNLVGGVDGSARARIVEAAEGNPLFARETVAMLVDDSGLIGREGDRWVAAKNLSNGSRSHRRDGAAGRASGSAG